eukprot:4169816-Prymnesium_polylepis.1
MVGNTVSLVVELAQRLVHADTWRPGDGVVRWHRVLGGEHGQQHAKPHNRIRFGDAAGWNVRCEIGIGKITVDDKFGPNTTTR